MIADLQCRGPPDRRSAQRCDPVERDVGSDPNVERAFDPWNAADQPETRPDFSTDAFKKRFPVEDPPKVMPCRFSEAPFIIKRPVKRNDHRTGHVAHADGELIEGFVESPLSSSDFNRQLLQAHGSPRFT